MRVVIVHEVYVPKMGYAATCLAKTLAEMGVDVHYVTTGLPPYYNLHDVGSTYGEFFERPGSYGGVVEIDGVKVHYLKAAKFAGRMRISGLVAKLKELKPDIVQTFQPTSIIPLECAWAKYRVGFKLFTGNHTTASVFPLAQRDATIWDLERLQEFVLRAIPGRIVSFATEKCYGATSDCSDVAVRFFGVPRAKIVTLPLGVDTDVFFPVRTPEQNLQRKGFRDRFGFSDHEIVCVYTGRFSEAKNPLLLAQAIQNLRRSGQPFRSLFFGNGEQLEKIQATEGATVHPFVHYIQLGDVYRGSDIGVWPTQESTSMIDAAASGIPIVVNHTIKARERVEGNGFTYELNNLEDLQKVLLNLKDIGLRRSLGDAGAHKMGSQFSWPALAARRIEDFKEALGR